MVKTRVPFLDKRILDIAMNSEKCLRRIKENTFCEKLFDFRTTYLPDEVL
jgi:hypothetical protein